MPKFSQFAQHECARRTHATSTQPEAAENVCCPNAINDPPTSNFLLTIHPSLASGFSSLNEFSMERREALCPF
jgi:hypothetical protein